MRFVGGMIGISIVYSSISERIRNVKEYESAWLYGCYMTMTLCPMVEIRSEIEWLWAVKSLGQSRSAWCKFATESVMGLVRKR